MKGTDFYMVNEKIKAKQKKQNKFMKKLSAGIVAAGTMCSALAMSASAADYNGDQLDGESGKIVYIINILLSISKYVGIALVVYGVYEVVMSFMQNQPEAKTKGIIMLLCGAVMGMLPKIVTTFTGK